MPKKGERKIRIEPISKEKLASLIAEKPIKIEEIIDAIRLHGTEKEIAGMYMVSIETLCKRIKEATGLTYLELRDLSIGPYDLQLRRNQLKLSEKQATMAIRLGELWLGQADTPTAGSKPADLSDVILGVEIGAICQK